ncbi:MAG TPA: hypothetical protein VJ499_05545, partial [Flavisolibacter sp.]|nr:hypothetical protein [Flavisolibacter sp.]
DVKVEPKTKTELLTSVTWKYDEYFIDYDQPNTTLAYKLGKTNSIMDLRLNKVKFNADGTYSEVDETGKQLNGTWHFVNNETGTEVTNAKGTFTSNIEFLDKSHYEWYDLSSGRYSKMIPQ